MRNRHWSYQGEKNRNAIVAMHLPCALAYPGCEVFGHPTVDHIVPREIGGPDTMENLRPACRRCNARRSRLGDLAGLVSPVEEASFFRDVRFSGGRLLNTSPPTRWRPLAAADYRSGATRERASR